MRPILFSLILLSSLRANAQLSHHFEGHIFAKYSYGVVDSANYHNYSVTGEYFVNPYIGLNYNFDLIFRNDGIRQFHTSMGALAGPPIILFGIFAASKDNTNSEFNLGTLGIALGILMLAAPDGVSFHIPLPYYKWDLSPYANVLGLDYRWNKYTHEHRFRYAMSYGVKTTYIAKDRFTLNAFIETRKVAGMGWSFGGGFGLGVALGDKTVDGDNSDFIEMP
jgi:hypothetical protein